MPKLLLLFVALLFSITLSAQVKPAPSSDTTRVKADSLNEAKHDELKDNLMDNIPVVSLDENELGDASSQNISSVLSAGRDPFFNAASFNFSAVRFRIRGYDADLFSTYMNGIPMENLDNGFTPFGLWGGLNDMMRNRDLSIGLRYNTFSFGELGSVTNIDSRASKQRKQTQIGYALSNRNYTHRVTFSHNTGISKKGWAFSIAGSRRWADEGYVPGTYYDGWSWFAGVDKRIGQKHLLSLVAFGAPTENGRQGAAVAEAQDLTGSHYYNPFWGYQNGKKRNASIGKTNQPFFIFTHDFRINNKTSLVTAAGYSFGKRSTTGIDWYNAADPRPDYYRYLPSYQEDPVLQARVAEEWRTNPAISQINWDNLYLANYNSMETIKNVNGIAGNNVTGKRSHYILEERVNDAKRFNANTVLNTRVSNHVDLTFGATYQWQRNRYYKQVNDLLGGDFYVDVNQFAERFFPTNQTVNQNNLLTPNRVLKVGDRFGYFYDMYVTKASTWGQGVFKFNKVDFFVAADLSYTRFFRDGHTINGLFPKNSFGVTKINSFTNYSVKAGATYKINGRNYLYVNGAYMTRAPFFENVYLSPRTRDLQQDNVQSETIKSVEGGYVLNAPRLKVRLSGYFTQFDNQMNVLTFYHDGYQNFVNYAINNIDKLHFGGEFGFEAKVMRNVTVTGAASVSRYYYNSRQNTTTTLDNTAEILGRDTVFNRNYRVGGTPQEAFSLGITYRSPKFWFVSLTGNYFREMWLDFNPIRRTATAVDGLQEKSDLWNSILDQQHLKDQYTLDFFGGYSYKLPRHLSGGRNMFLVLNLGINNLLNNKDIITGGFEQLRFDMNEKDVNKFPAKYFYAYGLNYFASVAFRF
ncbi:MAG: TonB-dependent receptor [Chitinophagaceae bacterium]